MRRRHRKAHRILGPILLGITAAVLALAYRTWSTAPLPEPVDPRLGPSVEVPAP